MDGLCHCGCGERTSIAAQTRSDLGHVKGQAVKFRQGHAQRLRLPAWNESLCQKTDAGYTSYCWKWIGPLDTNGYAKCSGGRAYVASVASTGRVIPSGTEHDHLCRNRWCVNPDHIEFVTHAENTRRGDRAKLSHEIAAEIRARYTGKYGEQSQLAREYGVSSVTVHNIVHRKSW